MVTIRTALALTAGLFAAAPALAAPQANAPGPLENAQIARELHQVVVLLNQANRDYDGYRAKAVADVRKAIHALEPGRSRPKKPQTPATTPKPPAPKEDQGVSDNQLKQALQQLEAIQLQLVALPGAHHQRASADVTAAIKNLQTALKVR